MIRQELLKGAAALDCVVNVIRPGDMCEALVLLINEMPHQFVDAFLIIHCDAIHMLPAL